MKLEDRKRGLLRLAKQLREAVRATAKVAVGEACFFKLDEIDRLADHLERGIEELGGARVVARPDLLRQVLEAHDSCDQTRIIEAMDAVRDAVYPAIASASNVAQQTTWADGMERAAELCDEEMESARALLNEQPHLGNMARDRVAAVRDAVAVLADTIRSFKRAGPDSDVGTPVVQHPDTVINLSAEDRRRLAELADAALNSRAFAHIDLKSRVENVAETAFIMGRADQRRAAYAPKMEIRPSPAPRVFPTEFQRELTVLRLPMRGDKEADADIEAIKTGLSTVFKTDPGPLYFHQLRLRVAREPNLAKRIAVYYKNPEGVLREVSLDPADVPRWPPGFEHELWEKESEIQKALFDAGLAPYPPAVESEVARP